MGDYLRTRGDKVDFVKMEKLYDGIDKKKLQENMKYWLAPRHAICPLQRPMPSLQN